jgi:Tol biopolymer transport system component
VLTSGTRLGPYEIQSVVGSGGMGEVYKARDTRLGRTVAIKILSPRLAEDPHFRVRFEREARAISQLNHPHICTLYDVGESAGSDAPSSTPVRYLVMEFVEGETLAERLARGPLPLDQTLAYAAQIADALDKAHRRGFIHRDLKPGNVMVTKKAGVKLLDFGLAEQRTQPLPPGWADAVTHTTPIGAPGMVLGTLQYLAPEQLEGNEADERTDLFACGAVIHEMMTGQKAFDGGSPAAVIAAILEHDRPSITAVQPSAPPALEHVVSTCLAKDPDERWQSAGDLTRELKWIASVASKSAVAHETAGAGTGQRVWMAVAGLFLLSTLALVAFQFLRPSAPAAPVYRTSILLPEGLRFPAAGPVGGIGRFAMSPDGRRIAFVATDPSGNQTLWVRPLDSLTAAPLAGTDGASSPFWSPDSRVIAFVARGQLKTIDPAGGSPVVVASTAFNATGAWNHDNVIVFTPTRESPLHSVSASGGTPRPVTTLDKQAGDVLHRNPFFLPDHRHFLYVAVSARNGGSTGPRAVYVGSLDATGPGRLLLDNGSSAKYSQGRLIFLQDKMLMAQPFDVDRLALTGEPRPVAEPVELNGPASAAFTVSETGVLVYQPAAVQGSQLLWFDRGGRQLGTVGDAAEYGDVELSPDGRRAALSVLDAAVNTRDLWVFDLARGVRTRFTFDRGDDVWPIWSPNGTHIFFASNRRGHFDLYQKMATGVGTEELLFADGSEKYPTSSLPDGRSLLYWAFDADGAILSVLPLTPEPKPTTFLPTPVGPGRLSPDGRWVTYSSAESGRSEVYVVPFPVASRKWQVSSAGGSQSRWRNDGKELFYAARDNKLMAVSVEGRASGLDVGPPRPLFEARPVGPRSFYDVTPDGQRFLVNSLRSEGLSSSITVVQNWSAAQKP